MQERICYGCMRGKTQSPVCEHCGYDERKLNEDHQLPIGTVLQNQYVVGRALGQGGFGITYIGWDRILAIPVAIKEYFPSGVVHRSLQYGLDVVCSSRDREIFEKHRERFLREARTLAQFASVPEIVQVRNFFGANNTAYIVMEYVQGITLKDRLKGLGRPMTVREALEIMAPVLRGLEKVHAQQLIHRDISPDNIMLPEAGGVKLIDFGTARMLDDSMRSKSTESVLKPGFAPMEQYNTRGNLGTWTDVYAICATFHYLLTGKLPPDAPSRIEDGEALPMLDRVPGLTPQLRAALQKGLAIRVADRIPTIEELRRQLFAPQRPAAAQKAGPAAKSDPIPQTVPASRTTPESNKTADKEKRKSRAGIFLLAAAAVIVAAAVLIFSGKPGAAPSAGQNAGRPQAVVPASGQVQNITLRVWASSDDQRWDDSWLPVMLDRFQQIHPEYNITWDVGVCGPEDAAVTVLENPSLAADVYFFSSDQLGTLVEGGALVQLGPSYQDQLSADVPMSAINSATHTDGGIYGFPVSPNTWFLWYNKSVYSQLDVTSLDTMLEKGVVAFPMNNSWYNAAFLLGSGATLFGPQGNDAAAGVQLDTPQCVAATCYMVDLVRHPHFRLDANGYGVGGMCEGTVDAIFSGTWDYQTLYGALGEDLGCAVLPAFRVDGSNYQMRSFSGYKLIGVNPHAENPQAALDLAAYLASPESQLLRWQYSGEIPAATACAENPPMAQDPVAQTVTRQVAMASVSQPNIMQMSSYWDPMTKFGQDLVNGSITKENARQWLQSTMARINTP